jgi:hypothetical protein
MCLFRLASFYDFILVWFVYFFTKKQTNESFMILFVIKYNKITWEGERM